MVGLSQPISGYVFVIDGVLIGADDGRWLALAGVAVYCLYLPLIGAVHLRAPTTGAMWSAPVAVTWLWVAFTGFMVLRGIALGLRVRTTRWMVTGA